MRRDHRRHLRNQSIDGGQIALRAHASLDRKGRVTDGAELAEGCQHVGRGRTCFRYEQRIAVAREAAADLVEIFQVKIGRQNVDRGSAGAPEVVHLRQRTAARISPRPCHIRLLQPRVREHGDVVFRFALGHHLADVAGVLPRHKDLVHRPVHLPPAGLVHLLAQRRTVGLDRHLDTVGLAGAEDLFPRTGGLRPIRRPHFAKFRGKRVFVLPEIIHQLLRHCSGKGLVRRLRAVT